MNFDKYRKLKSAHPYFKKYELNFIPYEHADIELWKIIEKEYQFKILIVNFVITKNL